MRKLLLRGCDVLSLEGNGRLSPGVSILIEDGIIQTIGAEPASLNDPQIQVKDVRGCLAIPGFWNPTGMAGSTLLHGDMVPPLRPWLRDWLSERGQGDLPRNQVKMAAYLHACQSIRNGVVGFGELSPHLHDVLPVTTESGLKASLAWSSHQDEWNFHQQAEDSLQWAIAHRGAAGGRIRTAIGYSGLHRCSEDFVASLAQRAHEERLPIWLELPDSDGAFQECLREEENDPVALLQQKGGFGATVRLHGISHLERWNIDSLRHMSVHFVMKSSSRPYRTERPLPWRELLNLGIPVAVGAEPSPRNRTQSVLRELQLLLDEASLESEELPEGFSASLLRLGSTMGAWVLGFEESGALTPGAAADIALVDTDQAHFGVRPLSARSLLARMRDGDVRHLLCDGRWLLKDGEVVTLDEARILWEARRG